MALGDKIAIIGAVGVPARYGGFETLAENLVRFHEKSGHLCSITVWCSAIDNEERSDRFLSADLAYVKLRANGVQSLLYDAISLWRAVRTGHNQILLLGVSGSFLLPLLRFYCPRMRVITNIDGIEWRRAKWGGGARLLLRALEWLSVRFSDEVIVDNQGIADYVDDCYGRDCHVIPYGGDHSLYHTSKVKDLSHLPPSYILALCRIEPENNIHIILDALASLGIPLVFVGNWSRSAYGRKLREQYCQSPDLYLLDPVYDPNTLYAIRARASAYVHGHSAGGTNPALVEMMHFGIPVVAFDCVFNRYTTEDKALYFESASQLAINLKELGAERANQLGADMKEIARRRYIWNQIGGEYFKLLCSG